MQRPSIWLMLVIVLATLLFVREPRLQRYDERYLRWLLRNSTPHVGIVPLTVVEIGQDDLAQKAGATTKSGVASPLEFSLFLQAALEFKPTVIAFESILNWRDQAPEQQQVFLDQAMRVPRLVAAAELTSNPDLDAPPVELQGFTQVTGRRGDLATFSGLSRQPAEDIRLLSTMGFINLPNDLTGGGIYVPLLFQYRGEVVPSFALQTALLWMRITPAEVKIDLGSAISLPNGRKIPIRSDGTALINPNAARPGRFLRLNELLLGAQQHEKKTTPTLKLDSIGDGIVLTRTVKDPQPSPGLWAAAIATIQSNSFVRRASWAFDCTFILILVVLSGFVRRFSRIDIALIAIALTAAYCLAALALVSRWYIWIPGVLPLSAIWLVAVFCLFAPRSKSDPDLPEIAPSPPSP
jgi:hypothetical protein